MKKVVFFSLFFLFIWISWFAIFKKQEQDIKKSSTIVLKDSIYEMLPITHVEINDTNPDKIYLSQIVTLKELKDKNLYKTNCKFCHGEDGKGDGVKARLNPTICPFDLTKETHNDKYIYYVLLNGENNMPSYNKKLDDNKIKILIVYIKKFKR
jgi:cytochrome c5